MVMQNARERYRQEWLWNVLFARFSLEISKRYSVLGRKSKREMLSYGIKFK